MTFDELCDHVDFGGAILKRESVKAAIKHVKPIGYDKEELERNRTLSLIYYLSKSRYMCINVHRIGRKAGDTVYCERSKGNYLSIVPIEELDERVLYKFYENPFEEILEELKDE